MSEKRNKRHKWKYKPFWRISECRYICNIYLFIWQHTHIIILWCCPFSVQQVQTRERNSKKKCFNYVNEMIFRSFKSVGFIHHISNFFNLRKGKKINFIRGFILHMLLTIFFSLEYFKFILRLSKCLSSCEKAFIKNIIPYHRC